MCHLINRQWVNFPDSMCVRIQRPDFRQGGGGGAEFCTLLTLLFKGDCDGLITCWSWARVMRITEGNFVLTAPAGMAGSFLRLGEQRAPGAGFGGSGREAWQEEVEEERRSRRCWSADRLRLMPAGWHWCSGSDRVVRRV